jgi:SAM-dependent methyltransferase
MDNVDQGIENPDYLGYVGPSTQYDFMGATQFRLLCTLGLRANHSLLDFGCGSLRAGRLFLTYLDEGKYRGVEPNRWLIEEAIENQIGQDLIRIKKPRFDYNADFIANIFEEQFDFILAQSIFSHTSSALIHLALGNFRDVLADNGLIVATFVEGLSDFKGEGWIYPSCVTYRPATITHFAEQAGLYSIRIPWYHPRQTWYVLARRKECLPTQAMFQFLNGAVLLDPEFIASWKPHQQAINNFKRSIIRGIPLNVKRVLRKLVVR